MTEQNLQAAETVTRSSVIEQYVKCDPSSLHDPIIKTLVEDRQKQSSDIEKITKELKDYMDALQKKTMEHTELLMSLRGAVKYVDSKIVQRHLELTKNV